MGLLDQRMKKWLVAVVLGLLCGFGAATAHARYEGQIVDAETKEPIEGVVVFMDWQQAILDHGHEFRDAFETLTDKEGRFSLPRYWSWNPWRWLTTESFVTIFKSGYEPIKGSRWEWMLKHEWGAPKGSIVWKIEDGRPVILLRKIDDLQKREGLLGFVGPGGDVPAEKSVLLRREKKKEHEIIFPK